MVSKNSPAKRHLALRAALVAPVEIRSKLATPEFWRLASGLVLFSFALTHFLNHSLGIISLEWMLYVQGWRTAIWRSLPGTILLAGAFCTHVCLALWRLAARRTWRMSKTEAIQIAFGLAIPFLGFGHVVGTRVMHELYGFNDNYAVILNSIKMGGGFRQPLLLLIVWGHSMIGINHWIRGKLWYPRWSNIFWVVAVLVPCLALSGWISGTRQIPYGIAEQQLIAPVLAEARANIYTTMQWSIWLFFGSFAAMVVAARAIGWFKAGPVITVVGGRKLHATKGATLLEITRSGGLFFAAVCGGRGRCTTCRCQIVTGLETLPEPGRVEQAALKRLGLPAGVRLACQIRPVAPLTIRPLLPVASCDRPSTEYDALQWGVEQRITVMFVDLRGFTSLAERLYPFDSVFLLNRFFEIMGAEVERYNGVVDKYLGDGFMALFGLQGSEGNGSRNAIMAAKDMLKALERANEEFSVSIGAKLRMGIGIHTGRAVVGRVGDIRVDTVTAFGDCVNVAARLEQLNKEYNSELIISDATLVGSGLDESGWLSHSVELRGRDSTIKIHVAQETMR